MLQSKWLRSTVPVRIPTTWLGRTTARRVTERIARRRVGCERLERGQMSYRSDLATGTIIRKSASCVRLSAQEVAWYARSSQLCATRRERKTLSRATRGTLFRSQTLGSLAG